MLDAINAFAFIPPILGTPGLTVVLLTLGLVFMPWRKFEYGFRLQLDKSGTVGEGEAKRYHSLMTARSAVVGTLLLVTTGPSSAEAQADETTHEPGTVHDAVPATTGEVHEPLSHGSLSRQRLHLAQADAPGSAAAQVAAEQLAAEREFWASVKASEDPADIQAYLEQFPGGMFEALARNWLRRIEKAEQTEALQATALPAGPAQEAPAAASPTPKSVEAALRLTQAQRVSIQRRLAALGFDVGAADGKFGPRTRAGIGRWQSSRAEVATGYLDAGASASLLNVGEAVPIEPPTRVTEEAMQLLSRALSIARRDEMSRPYFRAWALGAIAEAQASVGDTRSAARTVSEALPIARSNSGPESVALALGVIAKAQASAGDRRGAQRTVSEALRNARRSQYPSDIARALGVIAEAQASAGDMHGAASTIAEAQRAAARSDVEYASRTLSAIALAQASVGDLRGAANSLSKAVRQARSGEGSAGNRSRAFDLAIVARAQASIGNMRDATRTLSEAVSALRRVDEDDRYHVLGDIALAQASVGNIQGALSMSRNTPAFGRARCLPPSSRPNSAVLRFGTTGKQSLQRQTGLLRRNTSSKPTLRRTESRGAAMRRSGVRMLWKARDSAQCGMNPRHSARSTAPLPSAAKNIPMRPA